MYDEDTKLITVQDAMNLLRKHIHFDPDSENIAIEDATGRRLDEDVGSPVDFPAGFRSAMDGFALRSSDTANASNTNPVSLNNVGEMELGGTFDKNVPAGSCVRVPTGGLVPEYLDCVVPVEFTEVMNETVKITDPLSAGTNIDPPGSFLKRGDIVCHKGKILGSNDISILAAIGRRDIRVSRRIRVAVIPTGSELVSTDSRLLPGKVYDSNSLGVRVILENTGLFAVTHCGIVSDNRELIEEALTDALREYDIVITLGGTALGNKDLLPDILSSMEPGIIFHGIKAKPGMPTMFAVSGKKCIIGLPGPPVSAYLVMHDIIRTVLLEKAGSTMAAPAISATLSEDARITPGRYNMIPVKLDYGDNIHAKPMTGSSAAIGRLSLADGYFTHTGEEKTISAGSRVKIIPLHW